MAIGHTRAPRAGGHRDCCVVCYNTPRHTTPIARLFRTAYRVASRFQIETPRVSVYRSVAGQRSSILLRISSALEMASEMAHSRVGHGLLPTSFSFRAARIVAAKRIAYFRCSSIGVLQRKRGEQSNTTQHVKRSFLGPPFTRWSCVNSWVRRVRAD